MKHVRKSPGRAISTYLGQPMIFIIVDFLTILMALLFFIPQSQINVPNYLLVTVEVEALLIMIIVFGDGLKLFSQYPFLLFMLFGHAAMLFLPWAAGHPLLFNRYLVLLLPSAFLLVYLFNLKYRGNKVNVILSIVIVIIMLYPTWNTYQALLEDGNVCRKMGQTKDFTLHYTMSGVMGYVLVYSVMFVHIVSAFLVNNKVRFQFSRIMWVLMLLLCISSFAFVVISNYFTALMIVVFADSAIWLLSKSSKYVILLIFLFSIYSLNPSGFNESIIDFSLTFIPKGKTYERIESMKFSNLEDLDSRKGHMRISMRTIKQRPFLGGIGDKLFTIDEGISQHSFFLDTLAIYGLPLGLFFFYLAFYPFILLYKKCRYYTQRFFVLLMGAIIFLFYYRNNYTGHIGCVVYLIIPTVCTYVNTHFKQLIHKNDYIDFSRF